MLIVLLIQVKPLVLGKHQLYARQKCIFRATRCADLTDASEELTQDLTLAEVSDTFYHCKFFSF